MSDDQLDRDLERMAGNPLMARALKSALERIREGSAGSDLAEMARDVLAGRADLGTVAQSSAYSTHLIEIIGRYQQWQADLTPDERETLLVEAQRAFGLRRSTES